ncbi:MAG TPA: DUF6056 family protein, partial [Spirochaetota bacterium]|nr:DUF6056 family protein [Spirochaetota bacterium]
MTHNKKDIIIPFATVLSTFIIILILNFLTPLLADDYRYSFIFSDPGFHRVQSLHDVIVSQYHHWLDWGGRNIAHFFCQFFLMYDKSVFNIFNSLMYVIFTLLIYFHAAGIRSKFKPYLFVIINLLLWIFLPAWGQDILWLTGSCNYLWGSAFILAFLLPYRLSFLDSEKFGKYFATIMFIAGIVAGWSCEHTASAVMVIFVLFFGYKLYRREKIYSWEISGFAGFIIGFTLMIAAPGNYVRRAEMVGNMDHKYSF